MLASLGISLTRWDLLTPPVYVGLRNYERLLGRDPLILQALKVTASYTLAYVPTEIVGGLAIGLLLNQRVGGIRALRAIYYLPSVLSGVAFVVVWMWLLHPDAGLINQALRLFGVEGPRWLIDPKWALVALWMMSLWGLGRTAIIYLAGLKGIPHELYEAGVIDGAGLWQVFWHVTLPLLTPTIFFNLVLGIIATFQTFTSAYVATNGGPLNATLFYVLYLYRQAFDFFQMGYASAMAWALLLLVLALTLVVVRSSERWVYYESVGGGPEAGRFESPGQGGPLARCWQDDRGGLYGPLA
ncbi:MAG: sugar ABC transporter permease [Chloroflexi bacterium]|nr:sugar ABC transporter permease [Chloroflexota bacterium]